MTLAVTERTLPDHVDADARLLERDAERTQLGALVAQALAGRGAVAIVEGAAGLGKTALLQRLRAEVGGAGVLTALGGELEREFSFGLVRQLFEPTIVRADADHRARLLGGAAALAAPVVGAAPADTGADAVFATLHGLYWLVSALADEQPLVLVVDDAHWADAPSLRFLEFLARRIDELPVLLCIGMRPSEPGAELALLAALADGPHATVTRLGPLSGTGVDALVRDGLGEDIGDAVVTAAAEATGGNPLLLRELIRDLAGRDHPATAAAVREAVPSSVARSVHRRLAGLDPDARRLAQALAVLGDGRGTGLAAAAGGLDGDATVRALDVLRDVALIDGDPPRFLHPLLRGAVADVMPEAQRTALHREAARRLRGDGPPTREEELVAHLLAAPPTGEPWVVEPLRRSAGRALSEGAPDAAVRRLRRALEELPPYDEGRESLQLEAATAAARAGDPEMLTLLAEASSAEDPTVAARALLMEIVLHAGVGGEGMGTLARRIESVSARLVAPEHAELRASLSAGAHDAYVLDTRLAHERRRVVDEVEAAGTEALLAVRAFEAAAGDATATEAIELAQRALARSPLTSVAAVEASNSFWAVIGVLTVEGRDLADAALRDAELVGRRGATRYGSAVTLFLRAEWALAFGSAEQAEAHARESIAIYADAGLGPAGRSGRITLARALVRAGQLDEADALLDGLGDLSHQFVAGTAAAARGELRLAQRRPQEAVAALSELEPFCAAQGWQRLPIGTPTAHLARALAAAGDREAARALAEAEAAESERRGAPMLAAVAYVALGHALDDGLDAFTAAVGVGERTLSPFTRATARYELGAALRRANRRADARPHLAEARDLAHRAGAAALVERATEELVLAGGRPRRTALTGVASLTPSERRVAEHAASGLTNREIAEALFVTRKTVEYTLGRAFAKLDVKSRTQLAGLFDQA